MAWRGDGGARVVSRLAVFVGCFGVLFLVLGLYLRGVSCVSFSFVGVVPVFERVSIFR